MARRRLLVVSALAVLTLVAPATGLGGGSSQAAALDASILTGINQVRVEHGLVPLALSPGLTAAAEEHSDEMVADGYFAHSSADGTPFWQRLQRYYPAAGYGSWSVGENLLWSSGTIDAGHGIAAWMASPRHRANILNPAWREIGVAAVTSADAPGTYGGIAVTVVTADFGVRDR